MMARNLSEYQAKQFEELSRAFAQDAELSELEQAVLRWIAEQEPTLRGSLAVAVAKRRDYTGAGCFTYLEGGSPDGESVPVNGPQISSPDLEDGGGSILWLKSGRPDCLELYANGDRFPEAFQSFTLVE